MDMMFIAGLVALCTISVSAQFGFGENSGFGSQFGNGFGAQNGFGRGFSGSTGNSWGRSNGGFNNGFGLNNRGFGNSQQFSSGFGSGNFGGNNNFPSGWGRGSSQFGGAGMFGGNKLFGGFGQEGFQNSFGNNGFGFGQQQFSSGFGGQQNGFGNYGGDKQNLLRQALNMRPDDLRKMGNLMYRWAEDPNVDTSQWNSQPAQQQQFQFGSSNFQQPLSQSTFQIPLGSNPQVMVGGQAFGFGQFINTGRQIPPPQPTLEDLLGPAASRILIGRIETVELGGDATTETTAAPAAEAEKTEATSKVTTSDDVISG